MDLRDTLHLTGKLHHSSIIAATGFHVAAGSQLLKHRPFNTPFFCPDRLTLSRLIRRAIRGFLQFNPLLLRFSQLFRNRSSKLSPPRR
ncbi:hypothetical protein D3C81_2102070 [compost metagenome]